MGDALTDSSASDYERFAAQVIAKHDDLPPQLQKIARFVLDNPQRVALMTIAEMSEAFGVQPSAVIRFSKALGFAGFSEIQKILRGQLHDLIPNSYYARLNSQRPDDKDSLVGRMAGLAQASLAALPDANQIRAAAHMLKEARSIHVVGMRRAFGIASYASYLLAGFDAPVSQITGLGGMSEGQIQQLGPNDVLLAISFPNYRSQTIEIAEQAAERGVKVIALTDSSVSPLARVAALVLLADQHDDTGFRSVVGSMVTVQALAMEYGHARA